VVVLYVLPKMGILIRGYCGGKETSIQGLRRKQNKKGKATTKQEDFTRGNGVCAEVLGRLKKGKDSNYLPYSSKQEKSTQRPDDAPCRGVSRWTFLNGGTCREEVYFWKEAVGAGKEEAKNQVGPGHVPYDVRKGWQKIDSRENKRV